MNDDTFLSRWSRRKVELKSGRNPDVGLTDPPVKPAATAVVPDRANVKPPAERDGEHQIERERAAAEPQPATVESSDPPPPPPPPTLADVALLTREDSYARFVAPGVDPTVRNAAMKKLFTDPHYNVMDGLDIYIDDYGKPDPIPMAMLRRMTQSKSLGLFDHEDAEEEAESQRQREANGSDAAAAPHVPPISDKNQTLPVAETNPDEDPDLQLQPDDGTRRAGAGPGPDRPAES